MESLINKYYHTKNRKIFYSELFLFLVFLSVTSIPQGVLAQNPVTGDTKATDPPNEILTELFSGIVGAIIGVLGTLIVAIVKIRKDHEFEIVRYKEDTNREILRIQQDLKSQYDISLRDMRINSYKKLWSEFYILRKHSPPKEITYGKIRSFLQNLTRWYYNEGLFLSEVNQKLFIEFLDYIDEIIKGKNDSDLLPKEVLGEFSSGNKEGFGLRLKGSEIRTKLHQDIGTREKLIGINNPNNMSSNISNIRST